MLGLLAHVAAGGATGYANAQNARTEALNRVESAMFSAEIMDMFQQRRDERMAMADEAKYQRDIARDDMTFARDREAKKEDLSATNAHDLKKLEVSHGYDRDLEGVRQSAINQRTKMTQDNAERRHKERLATGLLNTSQSRSSGGYSQKEIDKANTTDQKRIFDLQKELTDPMNARNTDLSELLKQEIKRLQEGIAKRTYGDVPPKLDALGQ